MELIGDDMRKIDWCNPNRHGPLELWVDDKGTYWVFEYDEDDCDERPFESEALARAFYEDRREFLWNLPNWEAQREYDEMHGTINGEDPGVAAYRDLVGEEW